VVNSFPTSFPAYGILAKQGSRGTHLQSWQASHGDLELVAVRISVHPARHRSGSSSAQGFCVLRREEEACRAASRSDTQLSLPGGSPLCAPSRSVAPRARSHNRCRPPGNVLTIRHPAIRPPGASLDQQLQQRNGRIGSPSEGVGAVSGTGASTITIRFFGPVPTYNIIGGVR
jgi:hypothetical protein